MELPPSDILFDGLVRLTIEAWPDRENRLLSLESEDIGAEEFKRAAGKLSKPYCLDHSLITRRRKMASHRAVLSLKPRREEGISQYLELYCEAEKKDRRFLYCCSTRVSRIFAMMDGSVQKLRLSQVLILPQRPSELCTARRRGIIFP